MISALHNIGEDFSKNLNNNAYTFRDMVSDAFDVVSTYAVGCLFIEHNQKEIPELVVHYKKYRNNFFDTIKRYITKFIENGTVRDMKHQHYAVALIVETLCTWGMDIRYNLFETQDIAKEICLDNIITACQAQDKNILCE